MKNTAQHTTGPWVHVNDFEIWDQPGMYAQTIATVDPSRVGNTEAFYNAQLIAAAPALLSALHSIAINSVDPCSCMACGDNNYMNHGRACAYFVARAAIAQATGNTPTAEQPEEEDSDEAEEEEYRDGRTMPAVPDDFPVRPLKPGEPATNSATCMTCSRSWDDAIPTSYTPAPAGRCPFEYYHPDEEDDDADLDHLERLACGYVPERDDDARRSIEALEDAIAEQDEDTRNAIADAYRRIIAKLEGSADA